MIFCVVTRKSDLLNGYFPLKAILLRMISAAQRNLVGQSEFGAWDPGDIVSAKSSKDGKYHQARVLEALSNFEYNVRFQDFGDERVHFSRIRSSFEIETKDLLSVGSQIKAIGPDNLWHRGKIHAVVERSGYNGGHLYTVAFEESDQENIEVELEKISLFREKDLKFRTGQIISAPWTDGTWRNAEIIDIADDGTYEVEYLGVDEEVKSGFHEDQLRESENFSELVSPFKNISQEPLDFDTTEEYVNDECRTLNKKIKNIVDNFIENEKEYVRSLSLAIELWLTPLESNMRDSRSNLNHERENHKAGLIPGKMFNLIFSNFRLIFKLHHKILESIESCMTPDLSVWALAKIFINFSKDFEIYLFYISNFDFAMETLEKTLYDPQFSAFQDFYHQAKNDPRCADLDLMILLFIPLNRISIYKRMFEELFSSFKTPSEVKKLLSDVIEFLNNLVMLIDKSKDSDNSAKICVTEGKFKGSIQLFSPGRILIHQGPLIKFTRKGHKSYYHFILFNDLFMYAYPGWRYILKHQIHIDSSFGARDLEFISESIPRLLIMSSSKSFIVCANNYEDKNTWLVYLGVVEEEKKKIRSNSTGHVEQKRQLPESQMSKNITDWNFEDVCIWLYINDLDICVHTFWIFKVDGSLLMQLSEENLRFDMNLGQQTSALLLSKIGKLRNLSLPNIELKGKQIKLSCEPTIDAKTDASLMDFLKITNVTSAELNNPISDLKYTVEVQISPSRQHKVQKTYQDFENFEHSIRLTYFPRLSIALPDRVEFSIMLEKKRVLEQYLHRLLSVKITHEFLSSWLGISEQDIRKGISKNSTTVCGKSEFSSTDLEIIHDSFDKSNSKTFHDTSDDFFEAFDRSLSLHTRRSAFDLTNSQCKFPRETVTQEDELLSSISSADTYSALSTFSNLGRRSETSIKNEIQDNETVGSLKVKEYVKDFESLGVKSGKNHVAALPKDKKN